MFNLKRVPAGKQLALSFGALCGVLSIIGGLFFFSLRSIERQNRLQQSRALRKLDLIADAVQDVGQIQAGALRQVLANIPSEIAQIEQEVRALEELNARKLADYEKLADSEKEIQLYDQARHAESEYWAQTEPVLAFGRTNRDAEAADLIISRQAPAYDKFLQAMDGLNGYVEAGAGVTARDTAQFISNVRLDGNVLVGFSICIAIGTGFTVARMARRLKDDNRILEIEIRERRRSEEELRESKLFSDSIAENSTSLIYIHDLETHRNVYSNRNAAESLGYTPEQIRALGEQLLPTITHPEDLPRVMRHFAHFAEVPDNRVFDLEFRMKRASGEWRWMWSHDAVFKRRPNGAAWQVVGTAQDITKRRQLEQELKDAKIAAVLDEGLQRYSFLADTVPLIVWTARPDGGIDYYNKAWFDYTGLTPAQTRDWGWGAVLHPDDLQRCLDRWRHSVDTGEPYEIEYRFKRCADAAYRWFLGRASARRDEAGAIVQWVGTCTDIDDQKRAEAELRRAQADLERRVAERTAELARTNEVLQRRQTELQILFDVVPAMIWLKDTENRILRVNKRAADSAGKSVPELEGKSIFDLYPRDAAQYYAADREVMNSGMPKMGIVEKLQSPAGGEIWIETDKVPVQDNQGKTIGIMVMAQDITARRHAEETLRESEERFAGAFEFAPIGVALVAPDGRWLKVNRTLCEVVGYSEAELLTRTFQEITYPADLPADLENMRRLIAGEIHSYQMEKRYVHSRGHLVPILLNVSLVRDDQGQPFYFIAQIQDITKRKETEATRDRLAEILESTPDMVSTADAAGNLTYLNLAGRRLLGFAPDEDITKTIIADFIPNPSSQAILTEGIPTAVRLGSWTGETILRSRDGRETSVSQVILAHKSPDGNLQYLSTTVRDMTERKRLEAQLFQFQKMETVGKLAGGIAHEFNSILTAIIGQSELLFLDLPPGSPLTRNVTEIRNAAERAAALTRQLLAYGRKQILRPVFLDLNAVLTGMEGHLRQILPRSVDLRLAPASGLKMVKADATQIEQVIMNMVMNSSDAMPGGGRLTLETANVLFAAESAGRHPELPPGDYVMLAITDTGTGMGPEVKARLFEPFFSTKDVGEGTGLGLSTCYGIIRQSGGQINVESEPGRGATFKIYLPQVAPVATAHPLPSVVPDLPGGRETILLAEDDAAMRFMSTALLERLGYTVLAAADGAEALKLFDQHVGAPVALLFTDVLMPRMTGTELADRLLALSPRTRILFTSGYSANAVVHQGALREGVALLQKPFTPSTLAHKLREVLDQPGAPLPGEAQDLLPLSGFTP